MLARMMNLLRILVGLIGVALAAPALAHPHVWVTFKTELVYAADGTLTGIRHAWAFDDMFSTYATQGLPSKEPGKFTREELASLAEINISSLKDFEYFTFVMADGEKERLNDPAKGDYWLDFKDSVLTLHFTLPLKQPVKAHQLSVEVYDPSIFVDFAFGKKDPVALVGAPLGCKLNIGLPREMTFAEGKALAQIPADQQNMSMMWGAQFANKIRVACP